MESWIEEKMSAQRGLRWSEKEERGCQRAEQTAVEIKAKQNWERSEKEEPITH